MPSQAIAQPKIPASVKQAWLKQAKELPLVQTSYKATPELIAELCEAVAHCVPLEHAAQAVGLHVDTVRAWSKQSAEFGQLLTQAEAQGIQARVKRLDQHDDPKWAAWLLARHHKTRDHFKPPDYGAQRHSRVEIAFNFGRDVESLAHIGAGTGAEVGSEPTVIEHVPITHRDSE